jgi:hypothetical protein
VQNAGDEATVVQIETGLVPSPFSQLTDFKVIYGAPRLA